MQQPLEGQQLLPNKIKVGTSSPVLSPFSLYAVHSLQCACVCVRRARARVRTLEKGQVGQVGGMTERKTAKTGGGGGVEGLGLLDGMGLGRGGGGGGGGGS